VDVDSAAWVLVDIAMAVIATCLLLDWCADWLACRHANAYLLRFPDSCPVCTFYRVRYGREAPPHAHCREGRWPEEER
jgi:hypothetical protein